MSEFTNTLEGEHQPAEGEVTGSGSLEKVRDILFGAQAREYEKRFSRLEDRLVRESADVRDEIRKRFDALEAFFRGEIESLVNRLGAERDERTAAANEHARQLHESGTSFERKVSQLDDQITRSHRDLRQQLLDQSQALGDDMQRRYQEVTAMLDQATKELRSDKVDRAALANLLTEVAMRLNNEFTLPTAEDLGDV